MLLLLLFAPRLRLLLLHLLRQLLLLLRSDLCVRLLRMVSVVGRPAEQSEHLLRAAVGRLGRLIIVQVL